MADFKPTPFVLVIFGAILALQGALVSARDIKYSNCKVKGLGHPLSEPTRLVIDGELKSGKTIDVTVEFIPSKDFL